MVIHIKNPGQLTEDIQFMELCKIQNNQVL